MLLELKCRKTKTKVVRLQKYDHQIDYFYPMSEIDYPKGYHICFHIALCGSICIETVLKYFKIVQ